MSDRTELLTSTFVELADTLVEDFDVVELLAHMGERCIELFDAAAAGIVLADPAGVLRLMAASSEASEFVELVQIQNSEGPCYDCFHSGATVEVDDLELAVDRWPVWVPIALGWGFRSVQAFPMRLRGQTLGALNLFRVTVGSMSESAQVEAQALADVATIAILQHRAAVDANVLADQLHFALNSRILIEQAKGIISQSVGVAMDEAFERLRRYARSNSRQLGQIAQGIVDGTIAVTDLTPPA